jgi:RNA polymerase sigma factor (TIGR02999 family)
MTASSPPTFEVTELLLDWSNGDQAALEKLIPLVYKELRRLAHQHLRNERAGHTLQTTDLVHEAYLKLVNQRRVRWQNRAHFFGISAQIMRRILVDQARSRNRIKRGGGLPLISLDKAMAVSPEPLFDLTAFDEALTQLAGVDPRKARIVELRFFGGLSVGETAGFLDISEVTVMRDWKMAKAWLHKALSQAAG